MGGGKMGYKYVTSISLYFMCFQAVNLGDKY